MDHALKSAPSCHAKPPLGLWAQPHPGAVRPDDVADGRDSPTPLPPDPRSTGSRIGRNDRQAVARGMQGGHVADFLSVKELNSMGQSHSSEIPTDEQEFLARMAEAVGAFRNGRVLVIDQELGAGYVIEDGTNDRYSFARRWIPEKVFTALRPGTPIRFRINANNAIVDAQLA